MRRPVLAIVVVMMLVLLLGGAAFVGGRVLADRGRSTDNQRMRVSRSLGAETISRSAIMVKTLPADEMPDRAPDVAGLFVGRQVNRLFVGTGALSGVKVDDHWELSHDGPLVEVVTTLDTLFYRDDTLRNVGEAPPSGPVQQVLAASAVDELAENSTISAWGKRRGGQLVAEIIVFHPNG